MKPMAQTIFWKPPYSLFFWAPNSILEKMTYTVHDCRDKYVNIHITVYMFITHITRYNSS